MVQLKLKEDLPDKLVFRVSAFHMIAQMAFLTLISLACAALTMFFARWVGTMACVFFILMPGLTMATCGLLGCFNARSFRYTFDRNFGEFAAEAGSLRLTVPLGRIILVYIERERGDGGTFLGGSGAPNFSVTLMLSDGQRYHLDGGFPDSGSDQGPPLLHEHCAKIQEFLRLPPQPRVAVLELTPTAKPEQANAPAYSIATQDRLARWVSCKGIAPSLEPPLCEYHWLTAPQGVNLPPPARRRSLSTLGIGHSTIYLRTYERRPPRQVWGNTVVGRPVSQAQMFQPQPRQLQVIVPEGQQGQTMAVMTPDGLQVEVTVPPDATSGEPIIIQY